jgi:hypothetical protein
LKAIPYFLTGAESRTQKADVIINRSGIKSANGRAGTDPRGARIWRRRDYRLEFHIDDVKRADIEGAALQRVAVTGIGVKFADAGDRLAQKVGPQPPTKISYLRE